jgi:hypothetical protein
MGCILAVQGHRQDASADAGSVVAINFHRLGAWLAEKPYWKIPVARFAQLAPGSRPKYNQIAFTALEPITDRIFWRH